MVSRIVGHLTWPVMKTGGSLRAVRRSPGCELGLRGSADHSPPKPQYHFSSARVKGDERGAIACSDEIIGSACALVPTDLGRLQWGRAWNLPGLQMAGESGSGFRGRPRPGRHSGAKLCKERVTGFDETRAGGGRDGPPRQEGLFQRIDEASVLDHTVVQMGARGEAGHADIGRAHV